MITEYCEDRLRNINIVLLGDISDYNDFIKVEEFESAEDTIATMLLTISDLIGATNICEAQSSGRRK